MPILVSFFARQLIIIGVQLGIFVLIDKYITPLLNGAIGAIVKAFGVDEKAATDILANEILTTAESLGLTVALSKARLPLALADKLGFTTKGFAKRPVSPEVDAKVARARAGGGFGTVAPIVPTAAEATGIIAKATASLSGFGKAYAAVLGTLSTVFIGFIAINNLIDFGNWNSGAYQKTFQKIFAFVSGGLLVPDEDYRKTKTVSPEVFDKVYNTYKLNGAISINDPFKKASVTFTRDNLIDLLDQVGAILLRTTQKAATKDVLLASQLMIVFSTAPEVVVNRDITPSPAQPAQVRVFTGILSQGTLGSGLTFTARPDDIIESAQELQEAAANNLAATLAALSSSLVYEIKIVASVVSKDGFTQRGTAQKVISGYNKDGSPKYRTVVNKFAVLVVYLINEKGTRTKVRQITLGPTDVLRFNPTAGQIVAIETQVKGSISTSDIGEIQKVITTAPLAVAALPDAASVVVMPDPLAAIPTTVTPLKDSGWRFYRHSVNGETYAAILPWAGNIPFGHTPITKEEAIAVWRAQIANPRFKGNPDFQRFIDETLSGKYDGGSGYTLVNGVPSTISNAQQDERNKQLAEQGYLKTIPVGSGVGYIPTGKGAVSTASNPAVCAATTLWELSQALGEPLPNVAARAPEYERLGLGKAAFYTGTAEQNTKLLKALQKQHGCG